MNRDQQKGIVYIIGAGPGEGGLITLRGVELLKKADVVLYDYLVNEELLKHCRKDAEKIYVGKRAGCHSYTQSDINELIVQQANSGKKVARLKGGDPFIFGRGGEEVLDISRHNIPWEIVPGVTAASAAAYAGIPLTHRGINSTVLFITGHEEPGKKQSGINWEKISTGAGTIVFYMGVKNLPDIVTNLIKHGRPPDTPVALIRWGSLGCQETIAGTLQNITRRAEEGNIMPPAIIVVGEVVSLREKLRWFDRKPLFGRRIVVTRSRNQASILAKLLREFGAYVLEFPTIEVEPVEDFSSLDTAISGIDRYSWIVFTSVNGVDIFFSRLIQLSFDSRKLAGVKIAAIGSETSERLHGFGIVSDLVPENFTSEGMVEAFRKGGTKYGGKRILLPASEIARNVIPGELEKMGAKVDKITLYRVRMPAYSADDVEAVFDRMPDLVTFTSSSTVENLARIMRNVHRLNSLRNIHGASIGPVTSQKARELEIPVVVEAKEHTIQGLVEAVVNYFSEKVK